MRKHPTIDQAAKDLEEYRRQANEEQFPALIEAIQTLRPIINKMRQHQFIGVPAFRRLCINLAVYYEDKSHPRPTRYFYPKISISGRWLEERGFNLKEQFYLLELNGLLILCPANYPEHREHNAARECELIFGTKTS